ncbi:hypothetical protein [Gracilimonas tropica]|uniref:ORC-CDC6 family AAA ATPase n=1 Tax=Gracilimonas tropica TaxID=454600 RepID=UPI000371C947|nr:hypothetical protein [Gracilimonas tropica]
MRERNPFLLRTAERINNDDDFISLFSPNSLDLIIENLEGHSLWNQFYRFQSSPGGGKTSLLRLFDPSILTRIPEIVESSVESNEDLKGLLKKLVEIDAIRKDYKLGALCVYNSCASNYNSIINLGIDEQKKNRLFLSLINARILISFLRTSLEYIKKYIPDCNPETELSKIKFDVSPNTSVPSSFNLNMDGFELYNWCAKLEKSIYREIDGFENEDNNELIQESLYSVQLLEYGQVHYSGEIHFPKRFAIMFDDVQKLGFEQQKLLVKNLLELRPSVGVWFAERLDLMSLDEMLTDESVTEGRDFVKSINIEDLYRGPTNTFKNFANSVAQKRVERARDINISSFPGSLEKNPDIPKDRLESGYGKIVKSIKKIPVKEDIYGSWLSYIDNSEMSIYNKLLELKYAQLLIERNEKKPERNLSLFNFDLTVEEFEQRKKSITKWIPEYLVSKELGIPYYFGFEKLVDLSSSNIEQFLALSGRLFEEIISNRVLSRNVSIMPAKQEQILKKEAQRRWDDITRLSNHERILNLLTSIAKFCRNENDKDGFPYSGVTGIGIEQIDKDNLINRDNWKNSPFYEDITQTLSVAIANNLLEVVNNRKQGTKGAPPKTLFYLNRWICLKFDLPLSYAGWRTINLDQMGRWVKHGYDGEITQTKSIYEN